ncbi:MAG TPA: hypothetical protein VLF66_11600, partial [Thermoanaerobaculia bacterium]|nr:hypothetical protein [Thermoanaerobaculia bacterium]
MIRQRHKYIATTYLVGDLLATVAAFFGAWVLRFELGVLPRLLPLEPDLPDLRRYLELLPFILVLWPVVLYFHGLYQNRRGRSRVDEATTVLVAVILASVLLSVVVAWYRPAPAPGSPGYFTYSRSFLALFGLLDLALVVVARHAIRVVLQRIRLAGHNLQRNHVVGAGALGREITQKIVAHRELGFEVVGFVDDDPGKQGASFHGVPVLGSTRDVETILHERYVHQVFVALPLEAHRKMLRILQVVSRECVEVKLVPDILQYAT